MFRNLTRPTKNKIATYFWVVTHSLGTSGFERESQYAVRLVCYWVRYYDCKLFKLKFEQSAQTLSVVQSSHRVLLEARCVASAHTKR